jgi:hypothetical protein
LRSNSLRKLDVSTIRVSGWAKTPERKAEKHCKMKIEKCKLQIGSERFSLALSAEHLQFSIFNF